MKLSFTSGALVAAMVAFTLRCSAQCSSPLTASACSGGNGAASNGQNINSGNNYYFSGGPTTFSSGVNLSGGTLHVYGNLTLSSINFNSGTIIIESGGSLTINGSGTLYLNGSTTISNRGTLTINRGISMQNSSNTIINDTNATFSITGTGNSLQLNSGTSTFINRGTATIPKLDIQSTASSGAVCLGPRSCMNLTDIISNTTNGVNAPVGAGIIHYTGSAQLNSNLSGTSSVSICQGSSATTLGGAGFGSATVFTNCGSCNIALPVGLLYFRSLPPIGNGMIQFEWATESEQDNAYFNIESSAEGRSWSSIQRIAGSGTSHERHYYSATVTQNNSRQLYRLRQVDFAGASTISNIVIVNSSRQRGQVALLPNPTAGNAVLYFDETSLNVTLRDLTGRIYFRNLQQHSGECLPLAPLPAGVYTLEYYGPASAGALRFVKQ